MRKSAFLFILLSTMFLLNSCVTAIKSTSPCLGSGKWVSTPKKDLYTPLLETNCGDVLKPFDSSSWIESALASYKLRGQQTVRVGCGAPSPRETSLDTRTSAGQSQTVQLNFDFSLIDPTARVQKAMLFIYLKENPELMRQAFVKSRLNIGSSFANVANRPQIYPQKNSGEAWVSYDITGLAGRSVLERRNSVSFEVSLPCNRPEMPGVLIELLKSNEPFIVLEYK